MDEIPQKPSDRQIARLGTKIEHYRRRWLIFAPTGLLLIGLGLSLIGEATLQKGAGAALLDWVFWGTLGLMTFCSGLSFFGESIKYRTLFERENQRLGRQ